MSSTPCARRLLSCSLLVAACLLTVPVRASDAALADAAEAQDLAQLQVLLETEADVNSSQSDGMTALHWATYHDHARMAKALIEHGADANAENRYGIPVLQLACQNGSGDVVAMLLAAGADSNARLRGGQTMLMTAARTGHVRPVRLLIEAGVAVNAKDKSGQTAIMWAAAEGHAEVVRALIDAQSDHQETLRSGFNPLFFAVREGHTQVVDVLLEAGAGANEWFMPRSGRRSDRSTALLIAVENGHFETASALLEAGADPNAAPAGYTALHALTWVRRPLAGDTDPAPIGSGKISSLEFAGRLLRAGADVNARYGGSSGGGSFYDGGKAQFAKSGSTTFLLAARHSDLPLLDLLLEAGADWKIPNADNITALLAAAGVGALGSGDELPGSEEEAIATVEFMLRLGADINAVTSTGETAMHGAAYQERPALIQFLAGAGADIGVWNQKNKFGWTPLMIAQGHRPGNFRPSPKTVAAIQELLDNSTAPDSEENLDRQESDSSASTDSGPIPEDFEQLWRDFDPRAEPLETEVLHAWEEQGVTLTVVRFLVGRMKGSTQRLAAIYGYPSDLRQSGAKIPGLLQIHGGGQYADYRACVANAKRGYATLSIAWAGRIHAPGYQVGPSEVKLFWEGNTDDSRYRVTTDWGLLDAYHAPARNAKQQFPSIAPASWTLDSEDSPRNSGWYLCALAARRGLTFLERQPEVDAQRMGVYGHSMGGKLTVMTAVDSRVRVAAPSCGGISDRDNASGLFRSTLGDNVSLRKVRCPTIFLSPSNDFHGRIGDLPAATEELATDRWRLVCSPHHNHQDTPSYEVATMLWMDEHLLDRFKFPETPQAQVTLQRDDGVPVVTVRADTSQRIESVDVFYTLDGKTDETPRDREDTMTRYWRHAKPEKTGDSWEARIPLHRVDSPLWVFANVQYALSEPVSGAGYYYGEYKSDSLTLSSLVAQWTPEELRAANVRPVGGHQTLIEDFGRTWDTEWFALRPPSWARTTYKIHDPEYLGPDGAKLVLEAKTESPNAIVLKLDDYAAVVQLDGGSRWQQVELDLADFKNRMGEQLRNWKLARGLSILPIAALGREWQESLGDVAGQGQWKGKPPQFRTLHWQHSEPDSSK